MTFTEWQQSGQDVDDIGALLCDYALQSIPGRIYRSGLWIEDTASWPASAPGHGKGRWYTLIGNREYQSDNLPTVEKPLYEFACDEGLI